MTDQTPLNSDDDIATKTALTNFNISRIFKYFLLMLCMMVILLLTIVFCAEVYSSSAFRGSVNNELKDNIVGIVITALAVIGINLGVLRK